MQEKILKMGIEWKNDFSVWLLNFKINHYF